MSPPPGYVAYGGAGAYSPTQPISGLTKWLRILLIGSLAVSALALVATLLLIGPAGDFDEGVIDLGQFEDKLGLFLLVAVLAVVVSIAQIVVLIIWTYRMAKNMQAMGRQGMSMSNPGATIAINILGGCTLGILNFLMWREVWQGSDPDSPPGDPGWKRRPIGAIVNLWFGLTIGGAVLNIIAAGTRGFGGAQFGGNSEDVAEQFRDQLPITLLGSVVTVATAVVFILLVQQLAARHMKATGEAR
jgi:uncharacterized membrane protein